MSPLTEIPEAKDIRLHVESWSDAARTVQIKGFTKTSRIDLTHTTNSDRTLASDTFRIGSDFPVALHVTTTATSIIKGQLYVRVTLRMRNLPVEVLCAGYVHDGQDLTWIPGQGFYEPSDVDWDKIPTTLEAEETLNDIDKIISVPSGEEWKILWIYIEFVATATTGNRQIKADLRDDADDVIGVVGQRVSQTAGQTKYYILAPNITHDLSEGYGYYYLSLPKETILKPGYDIRIHDRSAIADGFDDMIIQMIVKKRLQI